MNNPKDCSIRLFVRKVVRVAEGKKEARREQSEGLFNKTFQGKVVRVAEGKEEARREQSFGLFNKTFQGKVVRVAEGVSYSK